MVERLEGHASAHGAIANDSHRAAAAALALGSDGHAEGGADRGTRVPDPKGVVQALAAGRKRRQTGALLDAAEAVAPSGQHFVRVGLVTDVPDQPVLRGVEDIMQRDGELDGAQAGREMAASSGSFPSGSARRSAGDSIAPSSGYVGVLSDMLGVSLHAQAARGRAAA